MTLTIDLLANQGEIGGGEVMLLNIAEALRALDVPVRVVAPAYPDEVVRTAAERGFKVQPVPGSGRGAYARNLRKEVTRRRSRILWANGLLPALATAGLPRRIVHYHQEASGAQSVASALSKLGALRAFVPSVAMQERMPGTEVLRNWVDQVKVENRTASAPPARIGFLGRISKDKGILTLLDAMEELQAENPDQFELVIAGDSRFVDNAEAAEIGAALAATPVAVEQLGWVSREAFFESIDCLVVPSLVRESFGLVIAEAMSAGVPVITSDRGALPEVAGSAAAAIVPAADSHALAGAIADVTEASSESVSPEGIRRWEEHFSPDAGRRRIANVVASLEPEPGTKPVAIAHDYLTQKGGAERVVLAFHRMYPNATIYTTLYNPETTFPEFRQATIVTSPLNRIGLFRSDHRLALPFLAFAASAMRVREAHAVVSSSGWAHGFRYDGKALIYCHTPARWLYLPQDYLGEERGLKATILRFLTPALTWWDQRAAAKHGSYVGNSTVVRERIAHVYDKDDVGLIFPPHSVDTTGTQNPIPGVSEHVADGYLLVVSRLMPYKNVDKVVTAAKLAGKQIVVVGSGPEESRIRSLLDGVGFLAKDLTDAQLRWAYAHCGALITVSHEDFGITPLEASAWGKPTIALRAGGFLDSIDEGVNGVYCESPDPHDIVRAIERAEQVTWNAEAIREHAAHFSEERFAQEIHQAVRELD
ncbi:glycosyltransferase family 4 protein [Bowdeniella massiliensis]|uniref:glycosyltransferase family 4 protein n=1 Tax=Bowdeniella massiliensis TaxID=2932264 RepID=UPI002028B6F7|nr:glycosyltransferase [Bowdeniella massiliensis]